MRGTTLAVPEEVAEAVRAEAVRQLRRPGEILVEFVQQCWPSYVAGRLRYDLGSPGAARVIQAHAEPIPNDTAEQARPSGNTVPSVRRTDAVPVIPSGVGTPEPW